MAMDKSADYFLRLLGDLNEHADFIAESQNHAKLSVIKRRLQLEEINVNFKQLVNSFDTESLEITSDEESGTVEYRFRDIKIKIIETLAQYDDVIAHNSSSSSSSAENSTHGSQFVKLPTIELPKFNGNHTEWASFYDTFHSLIDANENLTDMQKLHYLKACLEDEPKRTLESIKTNNRVKSVKTTNIFELPVVQKNDHKTLRTLLDQITINLNTIKSLGRPIKHWSDLIVFIISSRLDHFASSAWEESLSDNEIPSQEQLLTFLEKRCQTLESIQLHKAHFNKSTTNNNQPVKHIQSQKRLVHITNKQNKQTVILCFFCRKAHSIFSCTDFLSLKPTARLQQIEKSGKCTNCFRSNHTLKDCKGSNCKICNEKHHTLLHMSANHETQSDQSTAPQIVATNAQCHLAMSSNVLLSTAKIQVRSSSGKVMDCRALLDTGSQSHFITERLCKLLDIVIKPIDIAIIGINGKSSIKKSAEIEIKSNATSFSTKISCLVIPKITEPIPAHTFNLEKLQIPANVQLADPTLHRAAPVDLLIGAELFLSLLLDGKIVLGKNQPILQNTVFGYILGGSFGDPKGTAASCYKINLESAMTRFWELESVDVVNDKVKPLENAVEKHFYNTTTRLSDGRFMVRLPFKTSPPNLGFSKETALSRLMAGERKRARDSQLNKGYTNFMKEYLDLDHMQRVDNDAPANSYYLPHSCVIKENSLTTKYRVVFDGSSKSSSNLSLNDTLMAGPVLQPDLFTILIQFRVPTFVLIADISKMYRCILVHPDDRDYQKILWRDNPESPIKTFRLKTITYGLTSSSYQAIKCVQQLGIEERHNHPSAYNVIMNSFYVDDALFGSNSVDDLINIKEDLKQVLAKGGFYLSKWASNCSKVLKHERDVNTNNCIIMDKHAEKKTLGINWDDEKDLFSCTGFQFSLTKPTKRSVMSAIAQLFDPIGLINPIVTKAKIIMQKLWLAKIDWDDEIPESIYKIWLVFLRDLPNIKQVNFPRHVFCRDYIKVELHCFSDSSEQAYGGVIYVRSIDVQLNVHVNILCAKSRVAPLKKISLPRLELCGAVLVAQLASKVTKILMILPEHCHFWSDSEITLAWIVAEPHRWKTFVSNRVSEIRQLTIPANWHHVSGKDNPADLITRGAYPSDLAKSELWFRGPSWLQQIEIPYKNKVEKESQEEVMLERKVTSTVNVAQSSNSAILKIHSSFAKLRKTIAVWRRVMQNLQNRVKKRAEVKGDITAEELRVATIAILRMMQAEVFPSEIRQLQDKKCLKNSTIACLNPLLDKDNLLRVGGRLSNAAIPFSQKCPIILPKHFVTDLIIKDAHIKQLHAGQIGTLSYLRQSYWPISGRNQVSKVLRNCIKCFRVNPKPFIQMMGELPDERIQAARPFLNVAIDFGGPIFIKEGRGRGKRTVKSYIALFICMCTKAVHLELVGDLTTNLFLNSLKRLISRRGNVNYILSDNATNFVGAKRELAKLITDPGFQHGLKQNNITWKFIPPRAPNFGGLAEAGIKSVKGHLKRVIGENHLTYEEMYTLLVRAEAVLNSRPLTPLSNDPSDINALTPGHFIIGHPLTAPNERDHIEVIANRLSRWQLVEACRQHFWKRWSIEYLTTLHNRSKWKTLSHNVPAVGSLVLVKEDNLPPLQWRLGRIVEVHPGKDKLVRVVSVKCKNGIIKRAISKICALPNDS